VGCGPGTITLDPAASSASTPPRTPWRPHRERPQWDFQTGDAYALAYQDGAFDVAHAHQVLQQLADPVATPRGAEGSERPYRDRDRSVTDASLISDLDNRLPTLSTRHCA
jgi:hypothetical protein